MTTTIGLALALLLGAIPLPASDGDRVPPFADLVARTVTLKPELVGVHPRVFVTAAELQILRARAASTHRAEWQQVLRNLPAMKGAPPPPPGPQERRSQNNAAFAIAGVSLAYAIEQRQEYLAAAKQWTLAAIEYEPWGYTYNKPNVDLAAGHLLYAIGWAYDLLYHELTPAERERIRASLERHAGLVHDYFAPGPGGAGKRFNFTQNHDFIPTSGLAVAALALMGESADAPKWAALARAHHHRANQLLSRDGYYYEGMEYWIFSMPWLVHFYDAWEHATGESLWELGPSRNWKYYVAHTVLPDGQNVFDFGDIWEGSLTRAREGAEFSRVYPGGTLQSNFNVLYRVAARFSDPQAQAVAERLASFGHSNLEEYWTLLWRDAALAPASLDAIPLFYHFKDTGVVYWRSSWDRDATAVAFKAGPPEGHRAIRLMPQAPEWRLDSGHSHPDNGSFIIVARGKYLTGDTGYAGQPQARHHNTITVNGIGQGDEGQHDVWRTMPAASLDAIRITVAQLDSGGVRLESEIAGAYPAQAGLKRFTRAFAYSGDGRFAISDTIETAAPSVIDWYFHSDTPVVVQGGRALLGGTPPALALTTCGPTEGCGIASGPTILMAPGSPGSITKGSEERRGFHVQVTSGPSSAFRVVSELRLVDR